MIAFHESGAEGKTKRFYGKHLRTIHYLMGEIVTW